MNYDVVAADFDKRYESNRFDAIDACLRGFLAGQPSAVAEVGCGTGHWLAAAGRSTSATVIGVDLSAGMLDRARTKAGEARLLQATAEHLPFRDASLDRVFCVNAIHHFPSPLDFITESRRVLRPGGQLLVIGLDPHQGNDQWWVYDYFPSARAFDRVRYPSTAAIRVWAMNAGYRDISTSIAQHIPGAVPFDLAVARGLLDRTSTSQLMVISDADFEAGRARLARERPILRANLRLYASIARR